MHWRQTRPLAACHPFERQSAIRTLGVDIARVIETATQQLGPIDILVHNAGGDIAAKGGKPESEYAVGIREEDVRAVLDRNLLSTNPDLPGGGKGDDATASGPHRHHRFGRSIQRQHQRLDLRGCQGRHDALRTLPRHPHRTVHRNTRSRSSQDGRNLHARPHRDRRGVAPSTRRLLDL